MNKTLSIAIGVMLVLAIGGFTYWQVSSTRTQVADTATDAPGGGLITMADVAAHADGSSCWSVINDGVYDLTSWIPQHPGGLEAILQLCGTDGSEKFNGQHGGAPMQEKILSGFKIGDLAQ